MNRLFIFLFMLVSACALQCRHDERLKRSFDQICRLVEGKTAAEVERLLGPPDVKEKVLIDDERWTWWGYTYLDGDEYAPAFRGQVVNLVITFSNPASKGPRQPYSKWGIASYGVSYSGLPLPLARPAVRRPERDGAVSPQRF